MFANNFVCLKATIICGYKFLVECGELNKIKS